MKPRTGIKRYTPDDLNNRGKKPVGEGSRRATGMRRMTGMEDDDRSADDVDDEEAEEEEEPRPVVREKLRTKRGRGKTTRGRKN